MDKKTERRSIPRGIATRKIALIAALTVALLGLPGLLVDARAQFVIDHFKVYDTTLSGIGVQTNVTLTDQFGTINVPNFAPPGGFARFATPVVKDGTFPDDLIDPGAHQFWWFLFDAPSGTVIGLTVVNQFGTQEIIIQDPQYLVSPAHKTSPATAAPSELNHFLCYEVIISTTLSTAVGLEDQFFDPNPGASPTFARFFCNPVEKSISVCSEPAASVGDLCASNAQCDDPPLSGNGVCGGTVVFPILHPDDHLTCYDISPGLTTEPTVSATDLNFGPLPGTFILVTEELLCVPSTKTVLVNDPIPALPARGVIAFLLVVTGAALVVWRRRSRRMSA